MRMVPMFPRFRASPGKVLTLAGLLVATGALLLGCSSSWRPVLSEEIMWADRQREWGLVYYQSWQKERNRDYLLLSRRRTQEAILLYLDVQRRMGYAYPTFYVVDARRVASCQFLTQVQLEAASYAVSLDETERKGCFDQ